MLQRLRIRERKMKNVRKCHKCDKLKKCNLILAMDDECAELPKADGY